MSPGRCELLFLDEAVSRLMKPETAYLIGLAPVACCSTVSNNYICSICSAVRASAVHEARRSSSEPQPPTYLALVRQYSVFVRYFQKTFILPCVPDPVQYFRIISDMRSSYGTRIERADARRGAQMKQRRDEGFVRAELDDTHLS